VDPAQVGSCTPFPDCVIDSASETAALLAESLYSTPVICGDGVVQGSEQCDDGNDVDDDGCSNACTASACGDNIEQPAEECDDGNLSNTDACVEGCKDARCGDGFIQEGVEACEDGNDDPSDGCANCQIAAVSCDPAIGYRITVAVDYDPAERDLNAITFDLGYPVGVSIPGKNQEPSVQERISILVGNPGDLVAIGNDKDQDTNGTDELLTVGYLSFADTPEVAGDGIPPGDEIEVRFDCAAGASFDGADFTCAVTSANDINGSTVPATCSVRVSE
jgi:cysteine-rich repeat protein